jgi:hypothetical protein
MTDFNDDFMFGGSPDFAPKPKNPKNPKKRVAVEMTPRTYDELYAAIQRSAKTTGTYGGTGGTRGTGGGTYGGTGGTYGGTGGTYKKKSSADSRKTRQPSSTSSQFRNKLYGRSMVTAGKSLAELLSSFAILGPVSIILNIVLLITFSLWSQDLSNTDKHKDCEEYAAINNGLNWASNLTSAALAVSLFATIANFTRPNFGIRVTPSFGKLLLGFMFLLNIIILVFAIQLQAFDKDICKTDTWTWITWAIPGLLLIWEIIFAARSKQIAEKGYNFFGIRLSPAVIQHS